MFSARVLLVVSIMLSVVFAGVGYIYHLPLAEALSEALASELNVDKDQLRRAIVDALRGGQIRHAILFSLPGMIMAVLIALWRRGRHDP